MEELVIKEIKQNIFIVKINRPPDNFIKMPVIEQMIGVITEAIKSNYDGLLITSAINDIFISGHEIVDITDDVKPKKLKNHLRIIAELLLTIQRLNIPTVTLINGNCAGFGLELALATDFRIVVDADVNIGFPEVKLGAFPPFGGIYRLVKLTGDMKAREILMKGRLLSPQQALEFGLVNAVVPKERLLDEGLNLLKGFSRYAPLSLSAIKRAITDANTKDFMSAIHDNIEDYIMISSSDDYKEGKKAIQEGRLPVYKKPS